MSAQNLRPLITQNKQTALPSIYANIVEQREIYPSDIATETDVARNTVYTNLEKLIEAGLVENTERGTYELTEPYLEPEIVRSLAELGSPLRKTICDLAVDEGELTVGSVVEQLERSISNARKILNKLSKDNYLINKKRTHEGDLLTHNATEKGTEELAKLDNIADYLYLDGSEVRYFPNGIEGSAFQTAYEIEDLFLIAHRGITTVRGILEKTIKEEKATRRRLNRLRERGLLIEKRRDAKNRYEPTERTVKMIMSTREYENDILKSGLQSTIPEEIKDHLPTPFYPHNLFNILSDHLDDVSSSSVNEQLLVWKKSGVIEGDRNRGFIITD